jgi:hypothetical protein
MEQIVKIAYEVFSHIVKNDKLISLPLYLFSGLRTFCFVLF